MGMASAGPGRSRGAPRACIRIQRIHNSRARSPNRTKLVQYPTRMSGSGTLPNAPAAAMKRSGNNGRA